MARDPAFLFYPGDWLGGTMLFTRHQKGAYIDLLMAQFNSGHLSLEDVKEVLKEDFYMWEQKLKKKFSRDEAGFFYNKKLDEEIIKRKKHCEHQKENGQKKWKKEREKNATANAVADAKLDVTANAAENAAVMPLENENEIYNTVSSKENTVRTKNKVLSNSKSKKKLQKKFHKPEKEDVINYLATELQIDDFSAQGHADRFYDHFESNGWKVSGKAPMKDWQASVRNWIRNSKNFLNGTNGNHYNAKPTFTDKIEANNRILNRMATNSNSGEGQR